MLAGIEVKEPVTTLPAVKMGCMVLSCDMGACWLCAAVHIRTVLIFDEDRNSWTTRYVNGGVQCRYGLCAMTAKKRADSHLPCALSH